MTTSTLRRLPVPVCQPPYDDELPERRELPTQGALALQFELPSRLPVEPVVPHLSLVPTIPVEPDDDWAMPRHTPSAELPEPKQWAGRLTQAVVEVIAGGRPAAQLVRWTSLDVYGQLQQAVGRAGRSAASSRMRTSLAAVRSVHVSTPADGVAEVCAVVEQDQRRRAVAMRLEGRDGRWQCTALQVG
ncbi:MAG: hypothetical protein QOK42_1532 [Frankiaceae bacterium]|jgi:hypothetical protein|nr:hypothetical protein [Frankiaceae bacterium]MDX6275783.1 hypothetical protein [Frankiales bacterium]